MDLAGNVKTSNGEMGQDFAVFDLALHDPKTPQDRLIRALFRLAPVESAQWFVDHTGLPEKERALLEPDLQKAWKLLRALHGPNADHGISAMLNGSVEIHLFHKWMDSSSWILRAMANGLLEYRPQLQKAV